MSYVDYDDGFVAYLNGIEIARENINGESPIVFDQTANSYTEPRIPYDQYPWEKNITESISVLNEGVNVLALPVHNFSSTSSDFTVSFLKYRIFIGNR